MGADSFFDEGYGKTAREAFDTLAEDARHEYGYGGYSGTIAEKSSFTAITMGTMEPKAVNSYAESLLMEGDARVDDKWGPAGCIEMTSDRKGLRKFLFFGWASS